LVKTTLDPKIQAASEQALREHLLALDHRKGWRGSLLGHRQGACPKRPPQSGVDRPPRR
jgi:penicillin-binding protein 1A